MEVHTLTNKSALTELRMHLVNPKAKKTIYGLCVFWAVIGVLAFFTKSYLGAIWLFFLAGIFFLNLHVLSKEQVKGILKKMHELYHTDNIEGKLVFEDDAIRIINFTTNGELHLDYNVISLFVETQNYYTLFSKEHQGLIVDKQQFTPETNAQFLQLIREKMPALLKSGK